MMDMWKWNLAFQCVVNIGVRGSESVRTRVVEADMVPVIATILDNYIKVVDRVREKAEEAKAKALRDTTPCAGSRHEQNRQKGASFASRSGRLDAEHRSFRRQAPPPAIEIPSTYPTAPATTDAGAMDITPTGSQFPLLSPPERATYSAGHSHRHDGSHHHHHHRAHDSRSNFLPPSRHNLQPLAFQPLVSAAPSMENGDTFNLRPVRDIDRLPSMVPGFHSGLTSQPESPTTPLPPAQLRSPSARPTNMSNGHTRSRRRPSIRHQASSAAADVEDPNGDSMVSDESAEPDIAGGNGGSDLARVNIQDASMDGEEGDSMLTAVETPLGLTAPTVSTAQDAGTFNITHRSAIDGISITDHAATPTGPAMILSPAQTTMNTNSPTIMNTSVPRYLIDRPIPATAQVLAAMPRDEDVLMSLQLLAYVSKYCNLRSYFQRSHLVPKLKIGKELNLLDGETDSAETPTEEELEEEYLLADDFNIFPLVEKFTVRHHTQDMQYWAGVVMRNLCRKDDSRGGIRQCAYYQCGKWEEYTRQFAKCRRCRRTKYCSKDCQKSAWVYHRHWCVAASQ